MHENRYSTALVWRKTRAVLGEYAFCTKKSSLLRVARFGDSPNYVPTTTCKRGCPNTPNKTRKSPSANAVLLGGMQFARAIPVERREPRIASSSLVIGHSSFLPR